MGHIKKNKTDKTKDFTFLFLSLFIITFLPLFSFIKSYSTAWILVLSFINMYGVNYKRKTCLKLLFSLLFVLEIFCLFVILKI